MPVVVLFKPAPHLDDKHTVFGEMVEGQGALKKIEALGSQGGATKKTITIQKATIEVE